MQKTIYAHSVHQFNRWKDFLEGKVDISDMYILANTYSTDIRVICGTSFIYNNNDYDIFIAFAKAILPPK